MDELNNNQNAPATEEVAQENLQNDSIIEEKQEKKKGNYGHLFACASVGIFMLLLSWCATLLSGV